MPYPNPPSMTVKIVWNALNYFDEGSSSHRRGDFKPRYPLGFKGDFSSNFSSFQMAVKPPSTSMSDPVTKFD